MAFAFGSGEGRCFVILELYAGGNIILTDADFRILSLLRTHDYDDSVRVAVKQIYPFAAATKSMPELSGAAVAAGSDAGAGDVSVAASAPAGAPDGATYVALASLSCVRAHVCDSIEMAATMWCGVDVCACTRVARQGWQ